MVYSILLLLLLVVPVLCVLKVCDSIRALTQEVNNKSHAYYSVGSIVIISSRRGAKDSCLSSQASSITLLVDVSR